MGTVFAFNGDMLVPKWHPRAERNWERLDLYFKYDGRFELEDLLGSGSGGDVYRLRKIDPFGPGLTRAVIKVPSDNSMEMFGKEKKIVARYGGALHIGQFVSVDRDPMLNTWPGNPYPASGDWMYLEYIPNGSMRSYLDSLNHANVKLPNRLLWRFFLCWMKMANESPREVGDIVTVARMLYALAWNDVHQPDDIKMEVEQNHLPQWVDIHIDIAPRNVMMGSLNPMEFEHQLSPVIKLIDFGFVEQKWTPTIGDWMDACRELVTRMGAMFMEIVYAGGRPQTDPQLDTDILVLLQRLTSVDVSARPTIQELLNGCLIAVQTRDAKWYKANMPQAYSLSEENSAIRNLVYLSVIETHMFREEVINGDPKPYMPPRMGGPNGPEGVYW